MIINGKTKIGIWMATGVITITLLFYLFSNIQNDNHKKPTTADNNNNSTNKDEINIAQSTISPKKITNVVFYIENSASMFGYVHGASNYINVLTELAQMPRLVKEDVQYDFNFINGGSKISITTIGNKYDDLSAKLNINGMKCGNTKESNLNKMFQIALDKANGSHISILITDAIYDVGKTSDPSNQLVIKGRETRTQFINKLKKSNIETILIKLSSDFKGQYYHVSKAGSTKINQKRPYYVWIFGDAKLLNSYFTQKYISNLVGYENMVRFIKCKKIKVPYKIISKGSIGHFRFDHKNSYKLNGAEPDRHTKEFGFAIAVNDKNLPFPENYLNNIKNYSVNNYNIYKIESKNIDIKSVSSLKPTRIIYLKTKRNYLGLIEIKLNYNIPIWIDETNSNNDKNINNETKRTIGFSFLTKGIIEAYRNSSNDRVIAKYRMEITK